MKKCTSKRRRGFTLVEVMIASLVAVIFIASIISSTLFAKRQSEMSRSRISATVVMNRLVEETRVVPLDTLKTNLLMSSYLSGTETVAARNFSWNRTVVDMSGSETEADMIQVQTTVRWSIMNAQYNVRTNTYISKHGTNPKSQL